MKKFGSLLLITVLLSAVACTLLPGNSPAEQETLANNNLNLAQQEVIAPTPTPTMLPAIRLEQADRYLFAGDLESALSEYTQAFNSANDPEKKALALYGTGMVHMLYRDYPSAIDAFTRILGQYSDTEIIANTYYQLGISYSAFDEPQLAANVFAEFLKAKPNIIDAYIYQLQADQLSSAGDHSAAIVSLQSASQSNPAPEPAAINLQIGREYAALEDYTTAIQYYLSAYDLAESDYQKATADLLAGLAYQELGQPDQANTRFLDAVLKYPMAYDSYTSLTILVGQNYPVDEYMRGLVDYYAGRSDPAVYFYAIQAFERYLAGAPEHDGSVHYFKGLSHYYNGEYLQAIEEYQTLIDNYPQNQFWDDAWEEIAFTYWNTPGDFYPEIGNYLTSVQIRLDFVERAPQSAFSPYFLYVAGRTLEVNDELEQAAQVWSRLINEYPAYDYSYQALFLAGISYYRAELYEQALNTFQRCLGLAAFSEEKASAYLWLGKTYQKMGEEDEARSAWQLAESTDPTDYYGIRAGDLLNDRDTMEIKFPYDFGYDLDSERAEAEKWIRTTFNLADDISLIGLGSMQADMRITRGNLYWELGLYDLAGLEYESLRVENSVDPLNTYLLMNHLYQLGFYKPAILACRNVLDLAGLDDLSSLSAPIYFTHIRFGAYFRDLVVSTSVEENINPLIFYSVLRQESLFEPFISSAAGAQGIAQIMPATGKDIVDRIGWPPNYEVEDLLLAKTGIRLGAAYLGQQIDLFDGDILAALAAYNGGPGNALGWIELSNGDPDLFLEVIRYEETRNYLQQIVEFLNIYKLIYTRIQ